MPTDPERHFITDHNHRQTDYRGIGYAGYFMLLWEEERRGADGEGRADFEPGKNGGTGEVGVSEHEELLWVL